MSMIDTGECHECQKEIDMATAVADPMGNPLCKDCFNVYVKAGKQQDDNELI